MAVKVPYNSITTDEELAGFISFHFYMWSHMKNKTYFAPRSLSERNDGIEFVQLLMPLIENQLLTYLNRVNAGCVKVFASWKKAFWIYCSISVGHVNYLLG